MKKTTEDILYRVAQGLVAAPPKMAAAVALAVIGPAFDADRAWLIRLDEELLNFWVADEWCAEGVEACLPELPGVPTALIAHPLRAFRKGKAVVVADIEKLPPDAQELKEEMRREGNRATAAAPLFREGKLVALVGLDDVRKVHAWTSAEMAELKRLGELVLTAADRAARHETEVVAHGGGPARPEPSGCYLRAGNCVVQVAWEELIAITAQGDHTRVRVRDGRELFELKALSVWSAMLPEKLFLQVHRSHLVNWMHVAQVRRGSGGRWRVELRTGETLPVGRSYQAAVRRRISLRGAALGG